MVVTALGGGLGILAFLGMAPAGEKPLNVFVSIPPQVYFAEQIGGDLISAEALLPPGENPATFAPTPAKMARLARTDLFFRIGVPFEALIIPKIRNMAADMAIVDVRKGIALRRMQRSLAEENHGHSHIEGGYDPHIWLSPLLVKKQAKTMRDALSRRDPDHNEIYQQNCENFVEALETLHQDLKAILAPVQGKSLFVFHPAFGYLADAYGLEQVAVEMEGKTPKGKSFSRFLQRARKKKIQVIFVQPQFDSKAARKIARTIEGAVIPLNPLAEDYMNNLKEMAIKIRDALLDQSARRRTGTYEKP